MRPISALCLLAMSFSISVASRAQDPTPAGQADLPARKVATFSICAADPETGVCGAAVASMYPDVGRVVPYVRAGVGAFCTQHYHVPAWGERALDLLAAGKSPQGVLAELLAGDDQSGMRQLGIVSAAGQTAHHNPTNAAAGSLYWGAQAGRYYCCQGNTLTGRTVITATARAYEDTAGSLADRLIAALVAGDCAATIAAAWPPASVWPNGASTDTGSNCTRTRAKTPWSICCGSTPS
ncbi:MAG: DUF1028 domain-containing protein [Pirellulaceae bacterium]|nr:DUF1028 domain-containing protein [Pirellulaceae bacterium]